MSGGGDRPGEFDLISRVLAPLATGERGAFGLTDDAALLAPRAGRDLVLTSDAIVEGVHFLSSDPPFTIAQKALRVNLSDLAAKGARPRAYLMTNAWPHWVTEDWISAFAKGLQHDQRVFGISLIGGDTVSTPGPLSVSITAIGDVAKGAMIRRHGARPGDDVWVTGTIGDAGLGLGAAQGRLGHPGSRHGAYLIDRYRVPQPRNAMASVLAKFAHASVDVSDGLLADLEHVCRASGVGMTISAADVPLSAAAKAWVRDGSADMGSLMVAGDDYEVAFTAPASAGQRVRTLVAATGTPITRIGEVTRKPALVTVRAENGEMLQFASKGFTHF